MKSTLNKLPGLTLAVALMVVSIPIANLLGEALLRWRGIDPHGRSSPISAVLVAILMGVAVRNLLPLPRWIDPGLKFATTTVLRAGIVLVGIKLSALDVLKLGAVGVPAVMIAIVTALWFVTWLNGKLGLPERLGTLIAAGTSICGITAIVTTAPAIKADEREVAYAVANIALFGLLGMLTYPYLAHALLPSSQQVGLFLGTAIHDTSQVIGSALTYKEVYKDEVALQVATVTKLTRNLFLAVVVPFLAWRYARGQEEVKIDYRKLLPVFVLGFVAMAVLRSIGDLTLSSGKAYGLFTPEDWKWWIHELGEVIGSSYLLGTALAAVGLQTRFEVFKGVGFKPFLVGFAAAILVGITGFVMALTLGRFLV